LAITIAKIAQSKLATDILIMDLRKIESAPADFFVICSTNNPSQSKAVFDEIYYSTKKVQTTIPRYEGLDTMDWIVIDFF